LDSSPGVGIITRKTSADALKINATTPEGSPRVYTAMNIIEYQSSNGEYSIESKDITSEV